MSSPMSSVTPVSAIPVSGDDGARLPVSPAQTPKETEVPQDGRTLAPAGRLRGDAAELLRAIARARITPSAKDVLLLLYEATYASDNGTGWVALSMRGLADYFETWPSDIASRLNDLMSLGIIHRARTAKGMRSIVCLRPVADWNPRVFDFAAARKRHTKPGAGAPPQVRESDARVPLTQRAADIRDRDFMTPETVAAHVADLGGDERMIAAHWSVVERFQTATDQAFRAEWLAQLSEQLRIHTATSIISTLARVQAKYKPPAPWGYVLKCLKNVPKGDPTHDDDQFTTSRQDGRARAARVCGNGAAGRGGGDYPDTDISSRFIVIPDDDEPDDSTRSVNATPETGDGVAGRCDAQPVAGSA